MRQREKERERGRERERGERERERGIKRHGAERHREKETNGRTDVQSEKQWSLLLNKRIKQLKST